MTHGWLPKSLREVADVAGLDAALALAEAYGGRRVKLPSSFRPGSWLDKTVGEEAAKAIIGHFGTAPLDIPLAGAGTYAQLRRNMAARFDELTAQNASAAEIARALGITERAVRLRRAARRGDDGQGRLF